MAGHHESKRPLLFEQHVMCTVTSWSGLPEYCKVRAVRLCDCLYSHCVALCELCDCATAKQ